MMRLCLRMAGRGAGVRRLSRRRERARGEAESRRRVLPVPPHGAIADGPLHVRSAPLQEVDSYRLRGGSDRIARVTVATPAIASHEGIRVSLADEHLAAYAPAGKRPALGQAADAATGRLEVHLKRAGVEPDVLRWPVR